MQICNRERECTKTRSCTAWAWAEYCQGQAARATADSLSWLQTRWLPKPSQGPDEESKAKPLKLGDWRECRVLYFLNFLMRLRDARIRIGEGPGAGVCLVEGNR